MFYGHAIFIGGNSQKGSRYLSFPPGLSLSRTVDTKTDFNLNNIIATLSLISISSVKQFAGKCPDTYSNLILNSTRWMPKLVSIDAQSYATLTSQSLRATIGPLQDNWSLSTTSSESQESYLTTGMLPYKHSSFIPPAHGSIMLPPRQPRVFARLSRWQSVYNFLCGLQLRPFPANT